MYLLVCIVSTASLGLLIKWAEKWEVKIFNVLIINYIVCAGLGFLLLGKRVLAEMNSASGFYAYAMGGLFIVGFSLFAQGIRKAGLSLSALAQKMSTVLTVMAAWGIGEKIAPWQWVGLLMAICGMYLALYDAELNRMALGRKKLLLLFAVLGVSAAIEIGFMLSKKLDYSTHRFALLFPTYIFLSAAILGLCYNILHYRSISFNGQEWICGTSLGVPNFISIYSLLLALESGITASVLFPVLNCSVIFISALLSAVLFSEKIKPYRWLGLGLCGLAVFVMHSFAA